MFHDVLVSFAARWDIIMMLIRFKKKCNTENCSFALGIGMALAYSVYSGNTLENFGITIILGMVLGFWLKQNTKAYENDYKEELN